MLSAVYRKLGGHGNAHPDLRCGRGPEVALGGDAGAPFAAQPGLRPTAQTLPLAGPNAGGHLALRLH